MGAHYGAVYLRGARRGHVRQVLEQWAAEKNTRCLLAPSLRGWLAVYPQNYGVDGDLADRLAASVPGVVLHVFMYDDSVLGYRCLRDGEEVDEYCSDPGYFDDPLPTEVVRLRGRPELLADLLAGRHTVEELDAVLHPADGTLGLAGFALTDFARLLNLPNACTSYEYLMEENWIDRVLRFFTIRGLWRFKHIPSLRGEKLVRRQRLARRAQRWQELKREGTLLMYQPGRVGWILNSEPHLCPNPAGDGFYTFWNNEREDGPQDCSPPWDSPQAAPVQTELTRSVMATSPTGRWLAIGHGYDPGNTELWDMSLPGKVADLSTTSSNEFDFTPDESRLLVIGANEISVFEMPGGKLLKRTKLKGDVSQGVFDPSGRFAVLVMADELVLFDWQRGKRLRRWKLGQRIDPLPEMHTVQAEVREQLAGMKPEDFEQHFRKMAGQLRLPASAADSMLDDAREAHREMIAMVQSADWAEQMGPRGSEMPVRIQFSRDGRWLLCATDLGPRVYRWAEFPGVLEALEAAAAEAEPVEPPQKKKSKKIGFQFAPQPVHSVEGDAYQEEGEEEHTSEVDPGRYVYALAYDPQRELFLYGGLGGVIGCLEIATGQHRTLIELPGRPPIMQLSLSRDCQALACTTLPEFFRDAHRLAAEVCVWDYARLLAR